MLTTADQKLVPKGWGHELWIVNNVNFCGKLLQFNSGKKCSWHYHKIKEEVFFLQEGCVEVLFSDQDLIEKAERIVLKAGDSFHVPIGMRHQMIALEDSSLFEFSTEHRDDDSYRIHKGD